MNVRAHSRIIGNIGKGGKELPTRKAVKNDKGEVIYYKDIRPGFVRAGLSNFKSIEQVRAHTRHIDYEGRPFIRPAVGASLPVIVSEIKKELAKI